MKPYFKPSDVVPRTGQSWDYKALCAKRGMCDANGKPNISGCKGGGRLAIGELGGGWVQSDLNLFAAKEGIPNFKVTDISTDGKITNSKDPTQDASAEVNLDIQAALAAYYFTFGQVPVSIDILWGQDMTEITQYASVHGYDYLSWSWGAPESQWGRNALQQAATVVQTAIQSGMTICAAAGDNSSSDGVKGTHVDAMASLPGVIGCGGTSWIPGGTHQEVVWGDGNPNHDGTGGGYSAFFKKQTYQVGIPGNAPGKMVPDWSDVADPNTGVEVVINGLVQVIGGTSAVAPFISGFLAALGPRLGKVYSKIWTRPAAFKDITSGSNGRYRAQVGPDPCSGLGSMYAPQVAQLLLA